MNFIKKIFDSFVDEDTHIQFVKFSRGEFKDRAMINAKSSKDKFVISTTSEFANGLVKELAKKLGNLKTRVSGALISTSDLTGKLNFKDKKQFQGVKRYIVDDEMSGDELMELLNKFPKSFFALSFNSENSTLKIKPKAPKSGKLGSKGKEKPKPNFCKLITTDKELARSFVFEKDNWESAQISHMFIIEEIIPPEGETDYAKIREWAKRRGKIIREAEIDGEKIKSEKDFVA